MSDKELIAALRAENERLRGEVVDALIAFEQMQKHQLEFNEELMCMIVRSEVDFELHQTVLFFPEMNCCDMRGAINFAKRTDPKVKRIVTVSGGKLDTIYYYDDDDEEEEPGWYVNRWFVGRGKRWQRWWR